MSDTTFVPGTTIVSPWLNDVNDYVYGVANANVGPIQPGTGAVRRTAPDKMSDLISAFDFMTPAQIADVKARTRLVDVSVPVQNFFNYITNKGGYMPAGDYLCNTSLIARVGMQVCGDGIAGTVVVTTSNIKQVINDPAGTYSVTFKDLQFYNAFPVSNVAGPATTATVTLGVDTITVASTAGMQKGIRIAGTGIPANAYIRKISGTTLYLGDSAGNAVLTTGAGVGVAITTTFRQGPTEYQFYIYNGGKWLLDNVQFYTAFTDNDYSPNNHAGVWFDRAASASYFVNTVRNCWFHHAQILMGTSDSDIINCDIWANPFDFAIKLSAPGCQVSGGSISAGTLYGLWVASSGTEPFGALNHNITGVNIDAGDIWYTGYGSYINTPLGINFTGCRFNNIRKAAIYLLDPTGSTITGNTFLNNNMDGLGYADIEITSQAFQSSGNTVSGNSGIQTAAKTPTAGRFIREINAGFDAVSNVYTSNSFTSNYISDEILITSTFNSNTTISGNGGTMTDGLSGSWSPTFAGSTTPGTNTYNPTFTVGAWRLEGRKVFIQGTIYMTVKDGAMAGNVRIAGLPVSASSTAPRPSFSIGLISNVTLGGGYTQFSMSMDAGASVLKVFQNGSAAGAAELVAAAYSGTAAIQFSGSYYLD